MERIFSVRLFVVASVIIDCIETFSMSFGKLNLGNFLFCKVFLMLFIFIELLNIFPKIGILREYCRLLLCSFCHFGNWEKFLVHLEYVFLTFLSPIVVNLIKNGYYLYSNIVTIVMISCFCGL